MTIFCNHHIFSPVWHDVHIEYRIIALMKMYENPFIGAQNYQDVSFPTLLNVTADLSENDKARFLENNLLLCLWLGLEVPKKLLNYDS